MQNQGKNFELKFKEDILKIPGTDISRLPDQFNGWKNSSNISDFIVYKYPSIIYAEVKSRYGNTFNLNDFTQYERLLQKAHTRGVHPVVIIWFIDHDKVLCFPILSIEQMKKDGLKSINIKNYFNYPHIEIPSIKKRIFMDSNYNIMFDSFKEEDFNE